MSDSKPKNGREADTEGDRFLLGTHRAILLNALGLWLKDLMEDEERMGRANKRMMATLTQHLGDRPRIDIPDEPLTPGQELENAVMQGFISVMGMLTSIRECEYYFRRYPFRDFPISRSDYLRNCCEMLFDRICQLRDRMKIALNAIKNQQPSKAIEVGKIVKAFDKTFSVAIKLRNQSHHHARYSDLAVSQLSAAELLHMTRRLKLATADGKDDDFWAMLLNEKNLYQKSAKQWVGHVRHFEKEAERFVELTAQIVIENCEFVEEFISEKDREFLEKAQKFSVG